ncbi:c-type cytochrome [Vannielia litorea]|uniref:Cytochrome c n=1 Tax=Vannielia litorea TaxID=1217970 RepID=A0A1N6DYY0_9RHOB|nr:c-type cytochrome [Vannielia litorea]SIN75979.1 cytochrome c [Vannielia litorea]
MSLRAALATLVLLCAAQGAEADALGDVARGEQAFGKCKGCHQVGPEAANRIGPKLNGLFGRRAASIEGFKYSKAFARAGEKGLEWHADTLDAFLENPRQIVPGTRMSYRGEADATTRADLIAYLRSFSASPQNIPEADPTARATDHDVAPEILALVGDPDYGEYLSSECTSCHQSSGADEGIPSIILWPEEDFVVAMHAYKQKKRSHPVMNMIAGRLGDEEIAALAAFFATLEE